MSISTLHSSIQRYRRDVADWQKKIASETKKEGDIRQRIHSLETSLTPSTSASTRKSKVEQIIRLTTDLSKVQGQIADYIKKREASTTLLHKAEADLVKEEDAAQKKVREAEDKRHKENLLREKQLRQQVEERNRLAAQAVVNAKVAPMRVEEAPKKYDVFISHASEDKEEFVRPLAQALQDRGCEVWYDENTLRIGDRLRRSIDRGLANSRYGVVVLSVPFFSKNWSQYELDGLISREMSGEGKVILPIWHNISVDQLKAFSPTMVDVIAFKTAVMSIDEIADELANLIQES